MISRQKLIEERNAVAERFEALDRALRTGNYYDECCDVAEFITEDDIAVAVEALSQPPADVPDTNVGEWIPCSERLPEESGPYIVSVDYDGIPKVWRLYFTTVEYPRWLTFHKVTAWMPLPEPYKGVE